MSVNGLVALITGGGSGMGRATAVTLAARGALVVVTDVQKARRTGDYGDDVEMDTDDLIRSLGGKAAFLLCDVTKAADVKAAVDFTVETFGRLDIMVNNAGVAAPTYSVVDQPEEDYEFVMAVNAKGVFLGSKYAIGQMLKQAPRVGGRRGSIVNIASIAARVGLAGMPAYCASKGAVLALTRQLAVEFGPQNIRSNAVLPGVVSTSMTRIPLSDTDNVANLHSLTPLPNFGTPQDVAEAIAFLASDHNSFINGAELAVDGGLLAL